jgi:hypothetical protein
MKAWIRRLTPWGSVIELALFGSAFAIVASLPLDDLHGGALVLGLGLNGALLAMAIQIIWRTIEKVLDRLDS